MKKFVLVLGMMFSVSLFAQTAGQLMTDVALMSQKIEATKTLLLANLEAGKDSDAKENAKTLLADLYFEPEMYPLFETVIDETIVQAANCETAKSQLIGLFTDIFPEMLNTEVVNSNGIKLLERSLRQDVLSAIANGMFDNMKKVCTETEQSAINEVLKNTRRAMILATDATSEANYTALVCVTMNDVFEENGLKKPITFVK
jgi:hypothetical protein